MAVITISREMGSGGAEVGRHVAHSLGYDYLDKNIIEGIFRQYGLTRFDDLYTSMPSILDVFSETNVLIISMVNEIMEAVAQRGNAVIVGRGGFAIVGHYVEVLNVRIQAPIEVRVQRTQAAYNLDSPQEAEARVNADDRIRRRFLQMYYNKRWEDTADFDLILDTGSLSIEVAAQQIVDAVRAMAQKPPDPNAVTTASIEVDPVLADAVAKVLAFPLPPRPG